MDPNETLRIMRDESLPIIERRNAALHLIGWLESDGFMPTNTGYSVGMVTRQVLVDECRKVVVGQVEITVAPKVIRRVFKQYGSAEGQVLVEVYLKEGVVRTATRPNVSATWSPPLTEILNEDEHS